MSNDKSVRKLRRRTRALLLSVGRVVRVGVSKRRSRIPAVDAKAYAARKARRTGALGARYQARGQPVTAMTESRP